MQQAEKQDVVWINAGEVSGDMHGAALMRAMLKRNPDLAFRGMGGTALREAGMQTDFDSSEIALMGVTEVVSKLPRLIGLLGKIKKRLAESRPKAVILIDCPDFNFRVAKIAARLDIPVYYYISPQIWAWRSGRAKFLAKYCRKVLCILPFERDFYARFEQEADFVGHPLMDEIPFEKLDALKPIPGRVGILPGSRPREVSDLLPEFAKAAAILRKQHPDLTFAIARAPGMDEEFLRKHWSGVPDFVLYEPEERYTMMRESEILLAASGTVTLEAALIGVPTVVAYKLAPITYWLARKIVRGVEHISLSNLILKEKVFPELLQDDANAENIAAYARLWLTNDAARLQVCDKLAGLRQMMGGEGAPQKAASIILDDLAKLGE